MKKFWIILGIILVILIAISPYILHSYNEGYANQKRAESYREYVKNQEMNQSEINE